MESTVDFKFIAGARKNSKLLYLIKEKQIFMYRVNWTHKISKNVIRKYICYEKNCQASVQFIEKENKCLPCETEHSHKTDQEDRMKKFEVMNKIKDEVAKPNLKRNSTRNIFNEEVQSTNGLVYNQMKRNLRRIKAAVMPKPPTSPEDFITIFSNEQHMKAFGMCESKDNVPFYQTTVIENNFAYTVFLSSPIGDLILQNISGENRNYLIDATFTVVPRGNYKQLLIIAILHENHVFPFLFVLMTNKTKEIYEHLFAFINVNIIALNPKKITTDFEKPLRTALHKTFPDATLNGCWFHFCQALRRKALQFNELKNILRNDIDAKRILKKLMSLPLLSPQEMIEGFNICKLEAFNNVKFIINDGKNLFDRMFSYFDLQWMQKESPEKLTLFGEFIRTTSALEGYNSRLSSNIAKHGNFWDFLNFLRNDEKKIYTEFEMTIDGTFNVFERPKKSFKNRNYLIEKLTNEMKLKHITVSHFLQSMSNNKNDILKDDFEEDNNETLCENDEENIEENYQTPNSILCEICFKYEKNIILRPCMHGKICNFCFEEIAESHRKKNTLTLCPFCRQIVGSSEQYFI